MREVQRRRLLIGARDRGERSIQQVIAPLFNKRFKTLNRELRRARYNKRLHADGAKIAALYKQDDDESWQEWIDQFTTALETALPPIAEDFYDIEGKFWVARQSRPDPVEAQRIIDAYLARDGRQIKNIATETRDDTLATITDWYNTDASLPELIDQLEQYYSPSRAETIARTETSYITSGVSLDMMRQFGVGYWNWDLADEDGEWPCDDCVAKAQANPHSADEETPPLHPRDRCGMVYANADGSPVIYGEDLSFDKAVIITWFNPPRLTAPGKKEFVIDGKAVVVGKLFNADQPRDEEGRWTAGGGSYRTLRASARPGQEVHHIPADEASNLHRNNGPAIIMSAEDHALTASYGSSQAAREYRDHQRLLIISGKFREAQQMDIEDLRAKFGNKYDDQIKQMLDYSSKLKMSARNQQPMNPTPRMIATGRF